MKLSRSPVEKVGDVEDFHFGAGFAQTGLHLEQAAGI